MSRFLEQCLKSLLWIIEKLSLEHELININFNITHSSRKNRRTNQQELIPTRRSNSHPPITCPSASLQGLCMKRRGNAAWPYHHRACKLLPENIRARPSLVSGLLLIGNKFNYKLHFAKFHSVQVICYWPIDWLLCWEFDCNFRNSCIAVMSILLSTPSTMMMTIMN